jgi:hypothetical protein
VVKENKAGKNLVNSAYVFANIFQYCKYCFTDLVGKDSLAFGDITMPLWHPYPTTTCLGFLLQHDTNRTVSIYGVWSRLVRQAKTSLIALMFLPTTFTNVNIASPTWQGKIVWLTVI